MHLWTAAKAGGCRLALCVAFAFLLNPAPGQDARNSSKQMPIDYASVDDGLACLFTPGQLARLRGVEPPAKALDKPAATALSKTLLSNVEAQQNKGAIGKDIADQLNDKLGPSVFLGLDPQEAIDQVRKVLGDTLKKGTDRKQAEALQKVNDSLIATAKAAVTSAFTPPSDVACSMSPLTWQEANDIFGLEVAKQYIAFQIVVRNLNDSKEFLLHDVQLAVDVDPCGSFERFDGGRDRLLVRAIALRNQETDPRNRTVRILEGVASIAGAAVAFSPKGFAEGLGLFNTAIPAGKSVFPDYTVDQLTRISDLAFTSSGQTRTVVPKNGVAMFVTFIPSKPLEQVWWINQSRQVPAATGENAQATSQCKAARPPETVAEGAQPGTGKSSSSSDKKKADKALETEQEIPKIKPLPYKNWQPNALLEFRRHTFVVVAGVHITPEDDLKPQITEVKCPEKDGVLDLGKSTTDAGVEVLPCPVAGRNLDKIALLRLRDAIESNDTVTADGKLTITPGKPTEAVVEFTVTDLRKLTGSKYNVVWTDASKLETVTGCFLAISRVPILTSIQPSELKVMALKALGSKTGTLILKGSNLDLITGVKLVATDGGQAPALTLLDSKSKEPTVSYQAPEVAKLNPGSFAVVLVVDDKDVKESGGQNLVFKP